MLSHEGCILYVIAWVLKNFPRKNINFVIKSLQAASVEIEQNFHKIKLRG